MKTKRCCLCDELKPISEFYNHKRTKDGKAARCKGCHFTCTGRATTASIVAGDRYGHLIAIMPSDKRGKSRDKQWLFRCDCGQEVLRPTGEVIKGRYISCGCLHKRHPPEYGQLINWYVQGAKKRGIEWLLTSQEAMELLQGNCHYCGCMAVRTSRTIKTLRNGIDRLDNSKGYESKNCVSCCTICNTLKGTMPYNAFVEHISQIYMNLASP